MTETAPKSPLQIAEETLKPCPFCGVDPVSFPSGDGTGTMIECVSEDCVRPHVSFYGEGQAAKRWNTRSPDLALVREWDRMRLAMAEVSVRPDCRRNSTMKSARSSALRVIAEELHEALNQSTKGDA